MLALFDRFSCSPFCFGLCRQVGAVGWVCQKKHSTLRCRNPAHHVAPYFRGGDDPLPRQMRLQVNHCIVLPLCFRASRCQCKSIAFSWFPLYIFQFCDVMWSGSSSPRNAPAYAWSSTMRVRKVSKGFLFVRIPFLSCFSIASALIFKKLKEKSLIGIIVFCSTRNCM